MILEKNDSKKSKKQPKDKQAKKVLKILAKQKKQRGKNQRRDAPPLSSQRSLTYKAMYENGVCELKEGLYSRTFKFSDINYAIADQSEQELTFSSYCELLNSCDSDTSLQISIINRSKDKKQFEKDLSYELVDDGLDVYRKEMNHMISNKIKYGNSSLQKEKYITFN
ncbi:TPA: conjugal transfer protein, partial [Enterococcus faecium]|nr:conjugal transfer protein [Enterococcus faecium]